MLNRLKDPEAGVLFFDNEPGLIPLSELAYFRRKYFCVPVMVLV